MNFRLPKTFNTMAQSVLLIIVSMLLACTPTLDWRSSALNSHGDRYTLTFPGKHLSAQKTVTLNGASQVLTLHAVQAGDAQFALGHVAAADASQAQVLAQALAAAFAANLGVEVKRTVVSVGKTVGAFDVFYPATPKRYAQARFIWTPTAAYELIAVGSPSDLTPESADTFIRSLRFE